MNAMDARTTLLVQHDLIRCLLWTCTQLAKRSLAGQEVTDELDDALARLCGEVAAHHRAEVAVLANPVEELSWETPAHVLREQIAEHAALWDVLYATPAEDPDGVLEIADEIEAHMAAEERTFLAPPVPRRTFHIWSCGMVN